MPGRVEVLILAGLAFLAVAGGQGAAAQISEDEAFQLFQRLGCIGCHNGNVATSWDQILADLRSVQDKYGGSLDEFARNVEYTLNPNVKFNTWEDLKSRMAQNVGRSVDDPDIQRIFSFFESVALGAPVEQPADTETPAEAPAETTPAETPQAREEPMEPPAEEGVPLGMAAVMAAVILAIIVAAVYLFARRR